MAVSVPIQYIGKAETYLLHSPGEILIHPNVSNTASVTEEQVKLPVQRSIHQEHLDVLKLGDLCRLFSSDTFSMSLLRSQYL